MWNPLNVSATITSYSTSAKTYDQFRMGDLSAKFGDWSDTTMVNSVHNDSNLQMFGRHSLLGRSFVIMKKHSDKRYSRCEKFLSCKKSREWCLVSCCDGFSPSCTNFSLNTCDLYDLSRVCFWLNNANNYSLILFLLLLFLGISSMNGDCGVSSFM